MALEHFAFGVNFAFVPLNMPSLPDIDVRLYVAFRAALSSGARSMLLCFYCTDIDTASVYQNEADVGKAVRDSGVPRSELWITSKLQPRDQGEKAYEACLETLRRLDTD